jgi:hypothetical protein
MRLVRVAAGVVAVLECRLPLFRRRPVVRRGSFGTWGEHEVFECAFIRNEDIQQRERITLHITSTWQSMLRSARKGCRPRDP